MIFIPFFFKAISRAADPFRHPCPTFSNNDGRPSLRPGVYKEGRAPLQPLLLAGYGESSRYFPGFDVKELRRSAMLQIRGFEIYKEYLGKDLQYAIVDDLRAVLKNAPLYRPQTPMGKPMSVRMSAAGRLGWYSDRQGYRYVSRHPNGLDWPAVPETVLAVWRDLVSAARLPDC